MSKVKKDGNTEDQLTMIEQLIGREHEELIMKSLKFKVLVPSPTQYVVQGREPLVVSLGSGLKLGEEQVKKLTKKVLLAWVIVKTVATT